MTDLGTLGGAPSHATAINAAGQVVGWSANASGVNHAFLWENGTMTDLGTLGGNSSAASGINDGGLIVGTSQTSNSSHGFLWVEGLMTDLGTLGGSSTAAYGINDADQVVGESQVSTGLYHAFLWPPPLTPYHNVGVTGDGDPLDVIVGTPVTIHVTAHNEGNRNETFNVTTYAGSILIGTRTVTDLPYFTWNFGDGALQSGANLTHVYNSPGTFTASCLVTNHDGVTAEGQLIVEISPTLQVTAMVDLPEADPGVELTFSATTTGGSGGFTFDWAFGDGSSAQGATVQHAYAAFGHYAAIVTVNDSAGGAASNTVTVSVGALLSVVATVNRSSAWVGTDVTFTATPNGGSGDFPFQWDFGDRTTAEGATATHAYASPGQYDAIVTLRDSAGGTASDSVTVTISTAPVPL